MGLHPPKSGQKEPVESPVPRRTVEEEATKAITAMLGLGTAKVAAPGPPVPPPPRPRPPAPIALSAAVGINPGNAPVDEAFHQLVACLQASPHRALLLPHLREQAPYPLRALLNDGLGLGAWLQYRAGQIAIAGIPGAEIVSLICERPLAAPMMLPGTPPSFNSRAAEFVPTPPRGDMRLNPHAVEFKPFLSTSAGALSPPPFPPFAAATLPPAAAAFAGTAAWPTPPPPQQPPSCGTEDNGDFSREEMNLLGSQLCEEIYGLEGEDPSSARTSAGTSREASEETFCSEERSSDAPLLLRSAGANAAGMSRHVAVW
mmetsp:Transcript_78051/g.140815  ORF Transcript_78051/g.140815 Transcript_78051/m.140815 type:complete len:316 (-) Transcript_78051:50-997(-)